MASSNAALHCPPYRPTYRHRHARSRPFVRSWLASLRLRCHVVEITAQRGPEVFRWFHRHDHDRCLLAIHRHARLTPQGITTPRVRRTVRPIGRIDDVRPGRARRSSGRTPAAASAASTRRSKVAPPFRGPSGLAYHVTSPWLSFISEVSKCTHACVRRCGHSCIGAFMIPLLRCLEHACKH